MDSFLHDTIGFDDHKCTIHDIIGLVLGDIKFSASDYCVSHVMQLL